MVYLDRARGGGRSRPPGDTSNAIRSSSGSSIFIVSRTLAGRGYISVSLDAIADDDWCTSKGCCDKHLYEQFQLHHALF